MIMRLIMIILLVVVSFQYCLSGTTDPQIPDNKYIEYARDFKYVGKICGKYNNDTSFCASAVAIDDHHILTAAHVVKDSKFCTFYLGSKEFCISEIIVHKNFNDKDFGMVDIALGYCETSFDLSFYPALYEQDNEVGRVCSIAGYGFHGTFKTGGKFYDDNKRAGSNIIDSIQHNLLICSPSKVGDPKRTSLEFLIASGDSGGGLFIDNQLAGINSCIMAIDRSPSGKYNDESGHTRISKFISWVNEHKKK